MLYQEKSGNPAVHVHLIQPGIFLCSAARRSRQPLLRLQVRQERAAPRPRPRGLRPGADFLKLFFGRKVFGEMFILTMGQILILVYLKNVILV
jgi:hypothetical protein